MMKKQQGFTLIELMIVVVIIGILAAIGVPAYQNYTARAQATEGLQVTDGLRTDIAIFLAEQNRWATADDITGEDELVGKYFAKGGVSISGGDADSVTEATTPTVITIKFDSGANSGKAMTLTPKAGATGQIAQWVCASAKSDGIEYGRLPKSCQK